MKKVFISLGLLLLLSSSNQQGVLVYCKPEIKYCVHNLKVLKQWLLQDYNEDKIPTYVYQEYLLVLDNTERSLEMILDNKGQCDTVSKPTKFKYNLKQ